MVTKLSDSELSERIHGLPGKCWHDPVSGGTPSWHCANCGKADPNHEQHIHYATSYDAIIPVVQGMDINALMQIEFRLRTNDQYCWFYKVSSRELTEVVAEVLGGTE